MELVLLCHSNKEIIMKLTEKNKELIWITKFGNFKIGTSSSILIYGGICEGCGEPFLAHRCNPSRFCSIGCSHSGKNHWMYGKATEENANWKGGVGKLGIPLYDTYGPQLLAFEEVRIHMLRIGCVVYKALQVRCHENGCRKWFVPTLQQVDNRVQAFKGTYVGSRNFYCSEVCKYSCCTYRQQKYFRGQEGIESTSTRYHNRRRKQTPLLTKAEKLKIKIYKLIAKRMGKRWHLDHIVAIANGGSDSPDNLQIIPAVHNLRKGSKENYVVPEHLIFRL